VHIAQHSKFHIEINLSEFRKKDFVMLTRKPTKPKASIAVVLLAGILGQAAAATEELVVNGAEVAAQAQEGEESFREDMKEYVQSLNHDLKATLDKEFKRIEAPRLTLAFNEAGGRG
jgi:hypothetical protein